PNSGKTTVLDVVAHFLRRRGVPIVEFNGGARYAPPWESQLCEIHHFLSSGDVRHFLSLKHKRNSPTTVHLLDRGLVDRVIFTRALHQLGRVSRAHRDGIESMIGIPELNGAIDLCLVFTTSSALSLARESKNKLTADHGRIVNTTLLDQL